MKKLFFAIFLTFSFLSLHAQGGDELDIYINFQGAFRGEPSDEGPVGRFIAKDLRLELRGNIDENLWYRFRQKLYKPAETGSLDYFGKNVDFMMIGWRFAPKWKLEAGKFCQHWGGFEYDEVPMYVYQYSDLVDHMDIFFAGAALTFEFAPGQEMTFEVSDNLNDSFTNTYGSPVRLYDASLKDAAYRLVSGARFPLSYILNWNGSFLDGKVQTRWATGLMHQTASDDAFLVTLGQKYSSGTFQFYLDYMLERDGVDRLGIASGDLLSGTYRFCDVTASAWIARSNWQFAPGWNLMLAASTTGVDVPGLAVSAYRRHFGGQAALEYFPVKGQDLRFFLFCLGDRFNFRENPAGLQSYGTWRAEIGIMYNLKCF